MKTDAAIKNEDQGDKRRSFVEVVNAEKQLWGLIHSKGLLRMDVKDLYHKTRSCYEDMILNDHEAMDLRDVEYCLWKLHYKHIDEYRKRIRQSSGDAETMKSGASQDVASVQNSVDDHTEGFKYFLSEASEFYKVLIRKVRKNCGIPEEAPMYNKDDSSFMVEPNKFYKCQYACHRFFVCLGDLARYRELCNKSDNQKCKWSVAAAFYFQAATICPDSGNPQNQLALLATYVGDDFLALYHCVRSLAVKEPFPDAWNNLMLLFDKNRSYPLFPLSNEAHFNFLKPNERSFSSTKSQANGDSSSNRKLEATVHVSSGKPDLWPLFVRMITFFYVKSSSEDFSCAFASTMRELEAFLSLDDTRLKASLESYENLEPSRKGPYRALQLVSILIYIIHSLSESRELKDPIEENEMQQSTVGQMVWVATFICMGRLIERCLKSSPLDSSPLLVTVLVFVEWLVGMLDKVEIHGTNEKFRSAASYFFDVFCNFLNRLDGKEGEVKFLDHSALWEDYELQGFLPLFHSQMPLNFSTHSDCMGSYDSRNLNRAHRILHAAMRIVELSSDYWKWIFYDKLRRKFYTAESTNPHQSKAEVAEFGSDVEVKHTKQQEKDSLGKNQEHYEKGQSAAMEEEEVILFKPLTRHNSQPIYTSIGTEGEMPLASKSSQAAPSDEFLRHTASLFVQQIQAQTDPSNFHPDAAGFRFNKPFKQQDPLLKDSSTFPAGPPSLSGWVLNRESMQVEREKGASNFHRHELSPIEEIPSASFSLLSINENKDLHNTSPPYVAPAPSAPFLPDDTIWFRGNSSSFLGSKAGVGIREAEGILGPSPLTGYSNLSPTHGPEGFSPGLPGFIDGYPPLLGMSSSEWLYHYRNNLNLEQGNGHIWPVHFNSPGDLRNIYRHDTSRYDLIDRLGNPLASNQIVYLENPQLHEGLSVYGMDEQRKEKHFLGYQRPNPYGCGVGTEFRAEQPALLQYLKEREWQLQRESQVRGPTYTGK